MLLSLYRHYISCGGLFSQQVAILVDTLGLEMEGGI